MASRGNPIEPQRPVPRLYLVTPQDLVTPQVSDPAGLMNALAAALEGSDIAAVLLRLADADERTLINRAKALAPVVQDQGAAFLLAGHAELVARTGADGAHLTGVDAFAAALSTLKPERIAGCGGLASRHDAMLAAESGADYVMFGEPDKDGHRPSFEAVIERVAWWAEVFEIPCIGFADGPQEVEPLVTAGADFIAAGDWVFTDPRGPAAAVAEIARQLAPREAVE
jgi:thiamine-phosphate pyrophosphorylase